jgi:flagellar assembly factor FliW
VENMKLNTKYHGNIDYREEDIITFPKGLPGFENLRNFILIPLEENSIFTILHSTEDKGVGLVLVSPFEVDKDYEFKISDEKIIDLRIKKTEEVLTLNTVTLRSNIKEITTNLKAPIIINIKEKLGEQIILDNEKYKVKHPLFKE